MKPAIKKNTGGGKRQQTEPNRTRKQNDSKQTAPRGKKAGEGITPVKVKTERTNNAPAKRASESSDRRDQKDNHR